MINVKHVAKKVSLTIFVECKKEFSKEQLQSYLEESVIECYCDAEEIYLDCGKVCERSYLYCIECLFGFGVTEEDLEMTQALIEREFRSFLEEEVV